MPGPADTFAQIGQNQQVPQVFGQYLNPAQVPPGPEASFQNTGWEAHPHAVAGGEVALGFLSGIRRRRIQQAALQEANTESQLNAYRNKVSMLMQNPNLTEAAKAKIYNDANQVMAQHMQYEMKDAPKDGVAGFMKNLFTHLTGGPIKTREPIDFNTESGKLDTLLQTGRDPNTGLAYNQDKNYQESLSQLAQVAQQLKGPDGRQMVMPSDWNHAIQPIRNKVTMGAPGRLQAFEQAAASMVPSPADVLGEQQTRMEMEALGVGRQQPPASAPTGPQPPATAPPPQSASPEAAPWLLPSPASGQPPTPTAGTSASPPGFSGIDIWNPAMAPLLKKYAPGYEQGKTTTLYNPTQRGQAVSNVIENPFTHQKFNATTRELLPTEQQSWIPVEQYRGVLSTAPSKVGKDQDGYGTVSTDGGRTWVRSTIDIGDGKGPQPFKPREGWVVATTADGEVWRNQADLQSGVTPAGGVYAQSQANARNAASIAAGYGRQVVAIGATRVNERANLDQSFNRRIDAIKRSARGAVTATAIPGRPPTPAQLAAAEKSVQPEIDAIEKERADALAKFDAGAPPATATPGVVSGQGVTTGAGGRGASGGGDKPSAPVTGGIGDIK